jgi:YVTN family beta-propeller protein
MLADQVHAARRDNHEKHDNMQAMRSLLGVCILAAVAHAQTLLVLNKEGTLAFVDPAAKKVLATVRTGDGPHEVESDGKIACVSNYGAQGPGSTLSVIDIATRKELARVELGAMRRPHGIAVSEGKCYFTAELNKVVGRYDPATRQVDMLLGTGQNGTHMVMLNKDATQMYMSNIAGNSITVADRAGVGAWNMTHIAVGQGPEGFDVSPDGKQLWTAHSRDGGVSIIDLATKKVINTFNVQTKRSNRLKFTPDGRLILISDLDAGELLVLEHATRKELKRIRVGRGLAGILVTPDSGTAYAAATGDNNVGIIDLKRLELAGRLETGVGPDGMAWIEK